MNKKPSTCLGCPLYSKGVGFSVPEGKCTNGVLIVGDSIGAAEVHAGLPFRPYSESGVILERAIVSLGFTREQFGLYNVVNCQPPYQELVGAPYEQQTLIHCRQHVDAAVERFQPKVIVAMGALAIRALTGMHGKKMTVDLLQGYALSSSEYAGIRVVACYHPKYIQQGHWEVFPLFRFAIKKAVEIAKVGWREESLDYREEATIDDLREMWKRLQAEPDRTLSCDFETDGEDQDVPLISLGGEDEDDELGEDGPEDLDAGEGLADIGEAPKKTGKITVFQNITQVNFSDEIRTGLATVYNHQTKPWIQKILATENQKCGHNWWNFDAGVAMYNGLHVGGPQVHDTIWCLRGDCNVMLADGTRKKIAEIVDKQLPVRLLSLDTHENLSSTAITGWHKKIVPGQRWMRIKIDGSRYPIICTPDHQVWTQDGWKMAMDLELGDLVPLPKSGTDDLISGLITGDGYVEPKTSSLVIRHCEAQKEYAQAKANALGVKLKNGMNAGRVEYYCATIVPKRWRREFYKDDHSRRYVPLESDEARAIWYMDDACLSDNKRNGKTHSQRIVWSIHRYTDLEDKQEILKDFQIEFGYEGVVLSSCGNLIRISRTAFVNFTERIAKYIHPSMNYKLPEHLRGKYNGWMEREALRPRKGVVLSMEIDNQSKERIRYECEILRIC